MTRRQRFRPEYGEHKARACKARMSDINKLSEREMLDDCELAAEIVPNSPCCTQSYMILLSPRRQSLTLHAAHNPT